MSEDVSTLLSGLREPGQPQTLYRELEHRTRELVGHRLFTLLYVDGPDVARIYSSRPDEYPVSGRKPMGDTPWGDHVLTRRQTYLGPDMAGIRWAFFDHDLIAGMGLGSVINVPVVYDGRCLGTMNLLDVEHHYQAAHVPLVAAFAPLLIPAFLEAPRSSPRSDP